MRHTALQNKVSGRFHFSVKNAAHNSGAVLEGGPGIGRFWRFEGADIRYDILLCACVICAGGV